MTLLDRQKNVVAALQDELTANGRGMNAGSLKDLSLAIAAAVDKLVVLEQQIASYDVPAGTNALDHPAGCICARCQNQN